MNRHRDRLRGDLRDSAEVALHVELDVLDHEVQRDHRVGDEEQRVTVGRGARRFHRTDRPASAAAVVH